MRRLATLALLVGLSGCGGDASPSSAPSGPAADPAAALDRAQAACDDGDVEAGVAAADSALAAGPSAEALVARALCEWVAFDESGDEDQGAAALEDLTAALAQARVENADDAMLARIYSHRAALRRALGREWPATLADLNAAIAADTSEALYVLDRAVARVRRGDSAAAVRDLTRYLALDTLDTARGDLARQLRDEIRPAAARP